MVEQGVDETRFGPPSTEEALRNRYTIAALFVTSLTFRAIGFVGTWHSSMLMRIIRIVGVTEVDCISERAAFPTLRSIVEHGVVLTADGSVENARCFEVQVVVRCLHDAMCSSSQCGWVRCVAARIHLGRATTGAAFTGLGYIVA